jgi:hypothetical protein
MLSSMLTDNIYMIKKCSAETLRLKSNSSEKLRLQNKTTYLKYVYRMGAKMESKGAINAWGVLAPSRTPTSVPQQENDKHNYIFTRHKKGVSTAPYIKTFEKGILVCPSQTFPDTNLQIHPC